MEEKKCRECKYFREGVCLVPLWIDAELYRGRSRKAEDERCDLYEEEADALPV